MIRAATSFSKKQLDKIFSLTRKIWQNPALCGFRTQLSLMTDTHATQLPSSNIPKHITHFFTSLKEVHSYLFRIFAV